MSVEHPSCSIEHYAQGGHGLALLGPLNLFCLDGHHATGLARVSALEQLHASCVIQFSYIPDALLIDASLLLSFLAHPLNYLKASEHSHQAAAMYPAANRPL